MAKYKGTPEEILYILAKTSSSKIKTAVAEHPNVSFRILDYLVLDSTPAVRNAALKATKTKIMK